MLTRHSTRAVPLAAAALSIIASASAYGQTEGEALTLPVYSAEELVASGFILEGEAAPESCEGRVAVVRFNRVESGATLDMFKEAVDAHEAWVHGQGDTDVEFVTISSGGPIGDDDGYMFGTMLIYPSYARWAEVRSARSELVDDDYRAFVAKYAAATAGYAGFGACLE